MDIFKSFLSQFKYLTVKEIGFLVKYASIKKWKEGAYIHEIGKTQRFPGLLLSGLARIYYLDIEGTDKTIWIADKISILADPVSVIDKTPSETGIQAIKNSMIVYFDNEELDKLQFDYPGLMHFKVQQIEGSVKELYHRLLFFSTMNPEQRYEYLVKNKPNLIEHVPQKYLASYIGVTEVSLSRIKKRFKE